MTTSSITASRLLRYGVGGALIIFLSIFVFMQCSNSEPVIKKFDGRAFIGTSGFDGPKLSGQWTAWFDVSPQVVKERLTDWTKSEGLIKDVVSFELKESSTQGATFFFERRSPAVIIPNPTMTLHAAYSDQPSGDMTIAWKLVEGMPKRYEKTWTFRAEGSGTRVEQTFLFELPFNPPDFAKPDPLKEMTADVERFRVFIGSSRSLAVAP